MSPTRRTLDFLRRNGYFADVVERWVGFGAGNGGIRKDYLGFADVIAANPTARKIVAVQCCSGRDFQRRIRKLLESSEARAWRESGGHVWVMGWRKLGRRRLWTPRV